MLALGAPSACARNEEEEELILIEQLQKIMPHSSASRRKQFLVPLNDAMDEFEINTPLRQAAFLSQIAHESGSLQYVREIASGKAYEGRADLGNVKPGDGVRYKGRGLIQVTGRSNYSACSKALYGDEKVLLDDPVKLELPVAACRSAGWFWRTHGLNELADDGEFQRITRRINGGTNGMAERLAFYRTAKAVLIG